MRSGRGVFLMALLGIFLLSVPHSAFAQDQNLIVSEPQCSYSGEIPPGMPSSVHANVTSTAAIANVTFYYRSVPTSQGGEISQPYNLSLYNSTFMYPSSGDSYVTQPLPKFQNNTQLFGFVKAVDVEGNVAYSGGSQSLPYPSATCYYYAPAPKATLQLAFYILDVNPRYLNLTAQVSGALWNSETFTFVTLMSAYGPGSIYINQPEGSNSFLYDSGKVENTTIGYSGQTQLFPLDSYRYYLQYTLNPNLNYSSVMVDQTEISNGSVFSGLIGFSGQQSEADFADTSNFSFTSYAQFTPQSQGHPATIVITLQLTRNFGDVTDDIIIPIISVYTLLGFSLLLTRKDDLANRLLVYITVFVFSYDLDSNIRSLVVSPYATGPNMAELLAFALIPCTVVLAIFSIVRWKSNSTTIQNALDFLSISAAGIILWEMAQFTVRQFVLRGNTYTLENVTYTLAKLGWFGDATIVGLVAYGTVVSLFRLTLWSNRNRTPNLKTVWWTLRWNFAASLRSLILSRADRNPNDTSQLGKFLGGSGPIILSVVLLVSVAKKWITVDTWWFFFTTTIAFLTAEFLTHVCYVRLTRNLRGDWTVPLEFVAFSFVVFLSALISEWATGETANAFNHLTLEAVAVFLAINIFPQWGLYLDFLRLRRQRFATP